MSRFACLAPPRSQRQGHVLSIQLRHPNARAKALDRLRSLTAYDHRWEFALPAGMREVGYPRERWSWRNWTEDGKVAIPHPDWMTTGMSRAERKAWKTRFEAASALDRYLEAQAAAADGLEAPHELSKTRARLLRSTDPRFVRRGRDEDPIACRRRDKQDLSKMRRRMRQLGYPSQYDGSWPARRTKKSKS